MSTDHPISNHRLAADNRGERYPAVLAWLHLARVYQKVNQRSAERLRSHGLSLAQFDILAHVGAREGMSQQELADALLVTKGNVCQLLDRMETGGIIIRRQEGRSNRLYLTDQGRRIFVSVVPEHETVIQELFSSLNQDEEQELVDILGRVDRALR